VTFRRVLDEPRAACNGWALNRRLASVPVHIEAPQPLIYLIGGAAGTGKSTLAYPLAVKLVVPSLEF